MSDVAQVSTRAGGVLAATCISTLVVNANTSAVSILLPAISEDTGTSVETLQWAVTGYSLVGAAVIVTSGSLGDVFGRKRVFQLGLLLFVVSCVLIALAGSGGMVIAGRVIQGAAGATILACGLSLLSVANEGDAQLRAVSLWGAAAAVGAAAGPLLGGVLVDITGWQGLFWIDAAVAVLCMLLTAATVSESRDPDRPRSIDYAGTVLIALTLTPLILGVSKSGDWGWFSAGHPGLLRDLGRGRVRVHRGREAGRRTAAGPRAAAQPRPGGLDGRDPHRCGHDQRADVPAQPVLPEPRRPGLQPAPGGPGDAAGDGRAGGRGPAGAAAGERFGGRQTIGAGFALTTAGFVVVGFVDASWAYAAFLLPLVAIAVGMGMSNGPASSAATASVPENQVGGASGVSNMARYVGAAVATALAATIYGTVIDQPDRRGAVAG